MDIEIVGRHALFFDDDAMAAFANSSDALVEWHSLSIDRYDVRHLLSSPPPPRRRYSSFDPSIVDELSIEAELDRERYLDLPAHSDQPGRMFDLAFITSQKEGGAGNGNSEFRPPFHVPGELTSLPESDKAHQIIAKTALFVSRHGGQSEIILRVKQGDNPTFGFLMPGHELHAYFRYLVEHPQLLSDESSNKKNASLANNSGGALSLLGSVYDSGEDEEFDGRENMEKDVLHGITEAEQKISKKPELEADADKTKSVTKKSHYVKSSSVNVVKSGHSKGLDDKLKTGSSSADVSNSDQGMKLKRETLVQDPPPELKRLMGKLVEYIVRNGKQFETMLIEQDRDHGRFPFLLPCNQFHSYYLKTLQDAQELKVKSKSTSSHKDDYAGAKERTGLREDKDFSSSDLYAADIPTDFEKKEKFKMVINKSKKEAADAGSTETPREPEFTVDAAAAVAILEAATKGIKTSIISRFSPVDHLDKIPSSQSDKCSVKDPTAEPDSSETRLTKEQKLKAERLKRAKNFVAMLKSQEALSKTGESRCSSQEPVAPGASKPVDEEAAGHGGKKGEESSVAPAEADAAHSALNPCKNYFAEERCEKFLKRKYRSRTEGLDDADGVIKPDTVKSRSRREVSDDETKDASGSVRKRHRRRHSERYSSDEEGADHKHHRRRHHRGDESKEKDHKAARKKSREHSRKRASEYESEDDHREKKRSRRRKHHSRHRDETKLDDGTCSDDNRRGRDAPNSGIGVVSCGAREDATGGPPRAPSQPSDTSTEVPDDLRAKIRAMLIATRL